MTKGDGRDKIVTLASGLSPCSLASGSSDSSSSVELAGSLLSYQALPEASHPSPSLAISVVATIFGTPSGTVRPSVSMPLVAPLVVMHMGRVTVVGRGLWSLFVRTVNHRRDHLGIEVEIEHIETTGEVVGLTALVRQAATGASWPIRAKFRVREGRVVEIWSRRENYVAFFSEDFLTLGGAIKALRYALPVIMR